MNREPIAIVGVACRFPGARDSRAFWKLLASGVDAITRVPPERWDLGALQEPDPALQGKTPPPWGGFVEDVGAFDPQFFKIAPREIGSMDPQQRLLLEVTWEALEDAGQVPEALAGARVGVFVGISSYDYCTLLLRDARNIDAHFGTGNTNCIAANRISYLFDFRGPSMAIDTACSSSLVAVHMGCRSLWSGEATMVIAGGVQLVLSPWATVAYTRAGFLSPDGRCKAFDASANGYVRSEGAGLVVLKPLSRALADDDAIYAVIRGSAVNQDGRSNGLTAPNPAAQEAVLREAYRDSDVAPSAVQYVEAHGSGTRLGDPIEMKALAAVVGQGRPPGDSCAVGSVKSNIGHLEAAAGIAGLIKVALSLEHRQIPPSLHFQDPNPYIPFDRIPLRVPTALQPWPSGSGPALAGVSSFGFGGTNVHMVLEEAPARAARAGRAGQEDARPLHLLTLRARSERSLRELAGRYRALLAEQPELPAADVCYSANTGRSSFPHRLAVIAGSTAELRDRLDAFVQEREAAGVAHAEVTSRKPPRVAFLFTGLGAQHVDMGRQLYRTQPTFRAILDRCDEILRDHLDRPLLSLLYPEPGAPAGQGAGEGTSAGAPLVQPRRTFLPPPRPSLLDETVYGQPALFALEYALAELWRSWGVEPAMVLGHSVGELAAACVAGVFSLEDGLRLVAERARLMHALPGQGAMVAVLAPEARVAAVLARLGTDVSIAAINGPENVSIAGEREALRAAIAALESEGMLVQPLRVSQAFHSALIEPMLDEFEQVVRAIRLQAPRVPLVSNVTGDVLAPGEIPGAAYWRKHTRLPVQFQAGVQALHAQGCQVMLEIGPSPVLTYLGSHCLPLEAQVRWLPSLVEHQSDWSVMLNSLSALFLDGVEIDWKRFDGDGPRQRLSLPHYPFERKHYWFAETGQATVAPAAASEPAVPAVQPAVASEPAVPAVLPAAASEPAVPAVQPAVASEPVEPAVVRVAVSEFAPLAVARVAVSEPPPEEPGPVLQARVAANPARRQAIVAALRAMVAEVLHAQPSEIAPDVTFLDMGADSFSLVELLQQIETQYRQELSMRDLFEKLTTIDALATAIEQRLPPEPAAPQQAPAVANPARRQAIVAALRAMVAEVLHAHPSEIAPDVTFLDMGADSFSLVELLQQIETRYQQELAMRDLFERLTTIDALAMEIEQRLPREPAAPGPVAPEPAAPQQAPAVANPARRHAIVAALRSMVAEVLHAQPSEIAPDVTFLDMGADSFSLVELLQQIETRYQQELAMRDLFERLTTIDALASEIEQRLPPEPAPSAHAAPASLAVQPVAMQPVAVQPVAMQPVAPQPRPVASNPARRQAIVATLRAMVAGVLRADPSEIPLQVPFLDLGADSTMLIQVLRELENRYQLRLTVRQLFEELTTIDALASHVEQSLPPERNQPAPAASQPAAPQPALPAPAPQLAAPAPSAPPPALRPPNEQPAAPQPLVIPRDAAGHGMRPDSEPPPARPAETPIAHAAPAEAALAATSQPPVAASALERIFAQQLDILSKQLDILRGQGVAVGTPAGTPGSVRQAPAPGAATPLPAPRTDGRLADGSPHGMTPVVHAAPSLDRATPASVPGADGRASTQPEQQERHLQAFIARYTRRTAGSKQLAQRYRPELADNRAVAGFRMPLKEISYPIVGSRYRDARIWDIDGNEYVDIAMGFGVHLFGHGAPFIQRAILNQLERGFGIGPQAELSGKVASLFTKLTGTERVTFCQSGTEAVMTALRLARTATRREKIALFKGSFHGHFDGVLTQPRGSDPSAVPVTVGVSAGAVRDVVVLDYGEPSALDYIRTHAHELAAVLVEPVQSRRPDLQPRAFLHELRAITEAAGTALIFDEIVTGLRVHPGGAQAVFGVRADIATYGKIPGGGLPLAMVAGKQRFMDGIDGGQWAYGDDSYPQVERTFFAGTFNKPPLSLATTLAVLEHLDEQGPRLQEQLNERTSRLVATLNHYFEREAVPAQVVHFGSLFRFVLKGNLDLFYHHLIDRGVYVWEGRTCFLSTAHTEADVAYVVQAVQSSMEELRAGGFFPGPQAGGPGRGSPPPSPAAPAPGSTATPAGASPVNGSASQARATPAQTQAEAQQPIPFWERRRVKATPAARGSAVRQAARWHRSRQELELSLYYFGKYEAAYRDDKYDLLLQGARFADEHGFSALWVPERHFHPFGGFSPNPAVVCAALARETRRVQLRAGSVVVPLHHPVRIAEEWAVVDNLSQGRVGLSFASGWHPDDFVFAPHAYGKHRELMFEGIETVRALWRGQTIRTQGGGQNEIEVGCFPLPKPREIPIWITIVNNPETYARAGEIGAGVLTNLLGQTLEDLTANIERYREARARSGHDPATGHVTVLVHTFVGDDLEAVRNQARKPFCDYLDSHIALSRNLIKSQNLSIDLDRLSADDRQYMLSMAYERYVGTDALIGTPETCEVILDRLREAGVDEVACFVDFGLDARAVLDGLPALHALEERYRGSTRPAPRATSGEPKPGAPKPAEPEPAAPEPAEPEPAEPEPAEPEPARPERALPTTPAPEATFPLTLAQREALTLVELATTDTAIGASVCLELRGALRLEPLRRALQQVVDRHEILRSRLTPTRDALRIVPGGAADVPLERADLSSAEHPDIERAAREWLLAQGRRGFDLVKGPVFRASLARLGEQHHLLLLATHHTLCDGWSIGVLCDEISKLYTAECEGTTCRLLEPMPFREYVARQEAQLGSPEMRRHERYWLELLSGDIPQLDLPTDRPRPAIKTYRASRLSHRLDPRLGRELHRIAREHGCSFFMLHLAAYLLLLHRLSGQERLIIGIPVAGQIVEMSRSLVGHCANLLPILSNIAGCERFSDLLLRTKSALLDAFEHRDYSYHMLVAKLPLPRDTSRIPLVSVAFNLDRPTPPRMVGLEVGYWREQPIEFALSDTSINITEVDGDMVVDWNYNQDLFDRETVQRWRACFEAVLEGIAAAPGQRLAAMSILPAAERRRLLVAWNDTRASFPHGNASLDALFEQQAARTPDALAVADASSQLTFGELSRRSRQLAHHLRALGVDREARVALCLERSVDLIVATLAILQAGGAYVPLDPRHPAERLGSILADARPALLVTSSHLAARLALPAPMRALCLDELAPTLAALPATAPPATATPESAAYVLYTSGSTGQPRGVVVEHRSVVNLLGALHAAIYARYAGRPLRVAVNGSIAFDTSVKQIIQLLHGHALDIIPESLRLDGAGLCEHLRARSIEVLDCTPTQLRLLLAAGLAQAPGALRCVLVGGEAIDDALWQELGRAPIDSFNVYGPTECTVDATACQVQPGQPRPVIGRPLANVRTYVLDRDLQPVPIGVPGELFIAGAGVARGYLDDPALTNERFLPDPFHDEPGARMYRTGDKVRLLPDGNIDFMGRLDHQVKVRGFRVELGEVEAALSRQPGVRACVVAAREDVPGDRRLVAYFVPREAQPAPTPQELHRALRGRLPEYMLPAAFVAMAALPLTPNGKVDRDALPAPTPAAFSTSDVYVAPRTPTEELLASIWSEILHTGQPDERLGDAPALPPISVTANFFHLGGNSLASVRLLDAIERRMGQSLRIQDLLAEPTIEHLAELMERYNTWKGIVQRYGEEGEEVMLHEHPFRRKVLVDIRPHGRRPPLFFVPQLTGLYPSTLMAGIMDLARYMDTEQPFYGLQAQALAPELASGTTVSRLDGWHYDRSRFDRIVADCVALMDEVRPGGPYAIGGFCSGSRLSLEIARQLVERGRTVTGVVMLDPPVDIPAIVPATDSVGPLDGLDPELAAMTWYVARDIGWQTGWDLMQMYRALEELPPEKRWDHARDQLVAVGCIPAHVTAAAVRHVFELKAAESQVVRHVLRTIEPRPYDGPVTVLFTEPRRQSVTDQAVEQALQHMRTYLQGSLEVHFIPGDHRTLFEEPHIRVLMEHVNRFLARDRRA